MAMEVFRIFEAFCPLSSHPGDSLPNTLSYERSENMAADLTI